MSEWNDRADQYRSRFLLNSREWRRHDAPGRRFALGSTRGDHLIGARALLAHAAVAAAIVATAGQQWLTNTCWAVAGVLLLFNLTRDGRQSLRDTLHAIRRAWL